jgi:hypothetical protein
MLRPFFITGAQPKKQIDFDRFHIVILGVRYGYFKVVGGRDLLYNIALQTNNNRLTTFKGPSVGSLPTQGDVDLLFSNPTRRLRALQPILFDLTVAHSINATKNRNIPMYIGK